MGLLHGSHDIMESARWACSVRDPSYSYATDRRSCGRAGALPVGDVRCDEVERDDDMGFGAEQSE